MNDPKILTSEAIIKLLSEQVFEKFKGVRESQQFEFKQKRPYDFTDTNIQKNTLATAELAKDIASMGNAEGGVIICGLTRKEQNGRDIVDEYDFVAKEDFYKEQDIIGRIKLTIYPIMDNIALNWFPSKENPQLGLGVIIVSPQKEEKKFFVVKVCVIEGETLKGNYFGIPIRKDDKLDWFELKDMPFLRQKIPTSTQEQYTGIMSELKDIRASLISIRTSSNKKNRLQERMEGLINE